MARQVTPLSDTLIKRAKAKDKEYNLSDGDGLTLRVKPSGSKIWILNYSKPFTKKRTNIGFGVYPKVSLANARKLKTEAKELLANDIDPKQYRDALINQEKERLKNTLEYVSKEWLDVKRTQVSANHANDIWRSLELHIFPYIGKYAISQITAPLAIKTIKPIANKGSLETVKRINQRLNEIMTYAVNIGVIHSNPLAGIKSAVQKPKKKNYPTIPPNQLPKLMHDISIASIKLVTRHLIEWQLHTMVRPGEAVKARWSEIDFENELWNAPGETMKMKRPHSVPLTTQTLSLLESIKPISGHREYIFPADRNPRGHTNGSTVNVALKRMGYKDRLVAHGLRSIASTALNEEGFDSDVIESALAHIDKNEVRRAYNRSDYIEHRRSLMRWWSEYIEGAATGNVSLSSNKTILKLVNF